MSDEIIKIRLSNHNRFMDFKHHLRFEGTHLMQEKVDYFVELGIQIAVKVDDNENLLDLQELFTDKLNECRWVNGYNDVEDDVMMTLIEEWHMGVIETMDDMLSEGLYDCNYDLNVISTNIARIGDDFIDVERILKPIG